MFSILSFTERSPLRRRFIITSAASDADDLRSRRSAALAISCATYPAEVNDEGADGRGAFRRNPESLSSAPKYPDDPYASLTFGGVLNCFVTAASVAREDRLPYDEEVEVAAEPGRDRYCIAPTPNLGADAPGPLFDAYDREFSRNSGTCTTTPSSRSARNSVNGACPAKSASTDDATSVCTLQSPMSSISTAMLKVGGPSRSKIVFCPRLLRASSSPSVTDWTPPTKSQRDGFFKTFSNV